jgi:hypothetical protein
VSVDRPEFCPNCLHPMSMHRDNEEFWNGGCYAALHANRLSVLALTGCSCTVTPADSEGVSA